MKILTTLIFECLKLIFRTKHDIAIENMALRQQLAVQQRSIKRPKIKNIDRLSITRRISSAMNAMESTYGPTQTHRRDYEIA